MISTLESDSWFTVKSAIGRLDGLDHPPMFLKNKFGIAGHWKINRDLVSQAKLGWIDPFCGHGESPLYAKRIGLNFVGIEINPDSMNGYILPYIQAAIDKHQISDLFSPKSKVEIRLGDSAIFYPDLENKFDLCYTSPPYFDFEDYGFHNKTIQKCKTYDEYHEKVTVPIFENVYRYLVDAGTLALQTEKNNVLKKKWVSVIEPIGFKLITDTITGGEKNKYSNFAKRDQTLLIFDKVSK